ncbi:hypothetical protein INR49_025820 [Caranx melampygus]|nr:hypothetical protein INR49_025820 [Caranx melampygus]
MISGSGSCGSHPIHKPGHPADQQQQTFRSNPRMTTGCARAMEPEHGMFWMEIHQEGKDALGSPLQQKSIRQTAEFIEGSAVTGCAHKVNFYCLPYQPCERGNGKIGDAGTRRKDMCDPSQMAEQEKWKQACTQGKQSNMAHPAAESEREDDDSERSWFLCKTDMDVAELHNISSSDEWRCMLRVVWLALLFVVLLTVVTTVLGQIYSERRSRKKPTGSPAYSPAAQTSNDGKRSRGIVIPNELAPIEEVDSEEGIETLLDGNFNHDYTANLHHRGHECSTDMDLKRGLSSRMVLRFPANCLRSDRLFHLVHPIMSPHPSLETHNYYPSALHACVIVERTPLFEAAATAEDSPELPTSASPASPSPPSLLTSAPSSSSCASSPTESTKTLQKLKDSFVFNESDSATHPFGASGSSSAPPRRQAGREGGNAVWFCGHKSVLFSDQLR